MICVLLEEISLVRHSPRHASYLTPLPSLLLPYASYGRLCPPFPTIRSLALHTEPISRGAPSVLDAAPYILVGHTHTPLHPPPGLSLYLIWWLCVVDLLLVPLVLQRPYPLALVV